MANIAAPPIQDSVIELDQKRKEPFYLAKSWILWLQQSLVTRVQASSQWLQTVTKTTQSASIGSTSIPIGDLTAGVYRVSYYARITQAATTSSSLTVTIGWTETAVVLSVSGAAMTGNTTTTVQSGTVFLRSDKNASLTYATTYASVGATPMQYRLDVTAERIQ
jgi:hypothetical protein